MHGPDPRNPHPMDGFPQVCVIMNGANHKMSGISTYPFQIFGNGVWIGYEALIMPGVKIGDGAIVSSRSVVVSDVEPYTIVGGNPAKPIRARFSPAQIRELLDVAWWNWSIEKIPAHLDLIVSGDVGALIAAATQE